MGRFLKYFFLGLLVTGALLYQYQRNRSISQEVVDLKRELDSARLMPASGNGNGAVPSDKPQGQLIPIPANQNDITGSRQNALTRAIAATEEAVVGINVEQVTEVQNPWIPNDPIFRMLYDERLWPRTIKQRVENLGSGFFISPDGYIVTNEHVVRNAEKVVVTTTRRQKYDATVVGTDPLLDMALLKIDCDEMPYIRWGDSETCIVGEWVIAIGNPYGLFDINDQPSVSVGVISALHRDFERDSDGRIYSDMIQTDAAINRGNSGGPLINAEGEAVGMCTLIISESGGSIGIGFAIPSEKIKATIDDLLKGGVNRNYWLGIRAADMTGIMHRVHGLPSNEGAVVTSVEPGSPAAKAGIKFEDIILAINGQDVTGARDAKKILYNTDLRVGDKLTLTISRKGKQMDIVVILGPLPNSGQANG